MSIFDELVLDTCLSKPVYGCNRSKENRRIRTCTKNSKQINENQLVYLFLSRKSGFVTSEPSRCLNPSKLSCDIIKQIKSR